MSRSSLGNVTVPDLAGGENLTMNDRALVLLSGGQDSTVCLAWALDRFAHVETIGFDYGQKHRVELDVRPNVLAAIRRGFPAWAEKLGEDHLIDLTVLGRMSDTALTRDVAIRFEANGLPNTFVPGRNLLFLTFAAAVRLVTGVFRCDCARHDRPIGAVVAHDLPVVAKKASNRWGCCISRGSPQ